MEEDRDEGIAEKWIQSINQAMSEAHATTKLFSIFFYVNIDFTN